MSQGHGQGEGEGEGEGGGEGEWTRTWGRLEALSTRQLFFVGGAPRSGTTWLQQLLDAHPDVVCRGEGFFQRHLAQPMEGLVKDRRAAIAQKNAALFAHTGGFRPPEDDAAAFLTATGLLYDLSRQPGADTATAVGEKTPENIFFFPWLKHAFPHAKFVGVARDPRDVLASAWHFFQKPRGDQDSDAAKTAFIARALPSINEGVRALLALSARYPDDVTLITYEALSQDPEPVLSLVFRRLGVDDALETVARCVEAAAFERQSGRPAGMGADGAFHRKGVVGDWPSTFGADDADRILQAAGWMFPHFGWSP